MLYTGLDCSGTKLTLFTVFSMYVLHMYNCTGQAYCRSSGSFRYTVNTHPPTESLCTFSVRPGLDPVGQTDIRTHPNCIITFFVRPGIDPVFHTDIMTHPNCIITFYVRPGIDLVGHTP